MVPWQAALSVCLAEDWPIGECRDLIDPNDLCVSLSSIRELRLYFFMDCKIGNHYHIKILSYRLKYLQQMFHGMNSNKNESSAIIADLINLT
jgi:hypothetical protein